MTAGTRTAVEMHGDPGLQPERTSLAWSRTLASLLIASAILLRWAPHYGAWVLPAVALLGATAAVLLARQRTRYGRGVRGIVAGRAQADAAGVCALAAAAFAVGAAGLVLVLLDAQG
ncbi:DUF202 domain-containing protein [Brevibacterium album]|uniref:DUF202 domain-containing protein n=1 Tax=Brevibacterium album TaxID=417948 RepID=UPI00040F78FC|nr:DUF202 domain-containing protein [Brevibacterium album]